MHIKITDSNAGYLASRGMPRDVMRMRPFPIENHVITIDSKVEGVKNRRIPKKVQLAHLTKFIEKPFAQPATVLISSFPNDGKAKALAAFIMETAVRYHLASKFRVTRSKQPPIWHTLTGSFQDKLRDNPTEKPSMLIMGNLSHTSTQVKMEKVRDLIELYNDIPRIIVATAEDPITLANSRLFIPVNYAFYLATARIVEL